MSDIPPKWYSRPSPTEGNSNPDAGLCTSKSCAVRFRFLFCLQAHHCKARPAMQTGSGCCIEASNSARAVPCRLITKQQPTAAKSSHDAKDRGTNYPQRECAGENLAHGGGVDRKRQRPSARTIAGTFRTLTATILVRREGAGKTCGPAAHGNLSFPLSQIFSR